MSVVGFDSVVFDNDEVTEAVMVFLGDDDAVSGGVAGFAVAAVADEDEVDTVMHPAPAGTEGRGAYAVERALENAGGKSGDSGSVGTYLDYLVDSFEGNVIGDDFPFGFDAVYVSDLIVSDRFAVFAFGFDRADAVAKRIGIDVFDVIIEGDGFGLARGRDEHEAYSDGVAVRAENVAGKEKICKFFAGNESRSVGFKRSVGKFVVKTIEKFFGSAFFRFFIKSGIDGGGSGKLVFDGSNVDTVDIDAAGVNESSLFAVFGNGGNLFGSAAPVEHDDASERYREHQDGAKYDEFIRFIGFCRC